MMRSFILLQTLSMRRKKKIDQSALSPFIIDEQIVYTIRSGDNVQSLQRSVQFLTTIIIDMQGKINELVGQVNKQ